MRATASQPKQHIIYNEAGNSYPHAIDVLWRLYSYLTTFVVYGTFAQSIQQHIAGRTWHLCRKHCNEWHKLKNININLCLECLMVYTCIYLEALEASGTLNNFLH